MNTEKTDSAQEEIEGIGEVNDASWGDYPLDMLLVRTEHRTVHDIVRRIGQGSFVMDPDFQRDFIWDKKKQSKLIESVFMRIPLPVFYLADNEEGDTIVVDGLQRLSTFRDFLSNRLRLVLPGRKDLDKKTFEEMPPKLQNRIEDCNLTLYILDSKVPPQALLDMFERVNGGVPLSRQQMRNCLYMGEATKFLKDEAHTKIFYKATGKSLRSEQMRDREFVNRFCAFHLIPLDEYRGDIDEFLANALTRMNQMSVEDMQGLSNKFRMSLESNFKVFGEHAFRKYKDGQPWRSMLNAALWDVMITGLSRYPADKVESHATQLKVALHTLLKDEDFLTAISSGTNNDKRVQRRFAMATNMFTEVFGAH